MSAPLDKDGLLIKAPQFGQKFRISTPYGIDVDCIMDRVHYDTLSCGTKYVESMRFSTEDEKFASSWIFGRDFYRMVRQKKILAI
jgi:hypothetical protein